MLTELLVRKFVARSGSISDPRVRRSYGAVEGWVSVAVNMVVGAVKLVPGVLLGSVSLVADAIHSFSDVATSGVVIWGFRAAAKPSDDEHPFGHGRVESIASLVIALLLVVAAVEFAKSSVTRIMSPQPVEASVPLLVALVGTIVAKEWLSRFSMTLGRRIDSSALRGDAWHHRSDALSTAVVVLALVGARFGVHWLDGAAGLVVAGFLAWAGIALVKESVDPLIGQAPSPELVEQIRDTALAVEGVDHVHDVIVHRYGGLVVSSVHIEVSARLDVMRCHELAEGVEARLKEQFGGWAVVHVDPVDRDHPLYGRVEEFLTRQLSSSAEEASFHDLRIVGREQPCYVIFDLMAAQTEGDALAKHLRTALRDAFPQVAAVVINVEPRFVY